MGYVPPSFEEYMNPELMERRIRRQQAMTSAVIIIGAAALIILIGLAFLWG